MNEKQLAKEIKKELVEAENDFKNNVDDYICCDCFRTFNENISSEILFDECKKIGVFADFANNDNYYKRQIKLNKMNDCYIFRLLNE